MFIFVVRVKLVGCQNTLVLLKQYLQCTIRKKLKELRSQWSNVYLK